MVAGCDMTEQLSGYFWATSVHKANRHLKRHQISGSLVVLDATLDQGELLPEVYLFRGLCCRASLTHFFIRWCDTAVPPSVGLPRITRPTRNLYVQNSTENCRIGKLIIHKVPNVLPSPTQLIVSVHLSQLHSQLQFTMFKYFLQNAKQVHLELAGLPNWRNSATVMVLSIWKNFEFTLCPF